MENPVQTSIFIVDSDSMLAMALKSDLEKTFQGRNLHVSLFDKSLSCREQLDQKPDIVIVDHRIDDLLGPHEGPERGMIGMIRQKSPLSQVILFTGEEQADLAQRAMQQGLHDYIVKNDYMFRKISLSVTQCLKLKQLHEEIRAQRFKTNILLVAVSVMAGALITFGILVGNLLWR